ncbi:TVP38/TMEM64 family protein [Paenibacillus sp. LMG 31456]|uniref:TVP38/TMEM64 family membrane protein n=1 Tax=Paenibacillus foliorum TaxID=2654974 RepID=A0A972GWT2_9BACL|nr:TVP38/TMEM64 family protein [Paenibacillus foliorum]
MVNLNVQHLSDALNSWGLWGRIAGALLVFVQTVLPFIPFVVIAGANVLIFGFWMGFLVNYVASVLGAIIFFWIARYYAKDWVERKLKKYVYLNKINDKLENNGFMYITIGRVIPVIPSFGINLAAAVMKVSTRDFVMGTIVGKAPIILLESLIGHDLLYFHQYKGRFLILSALFIGLILVGNVYKKRWFGSNKS